MSDFEIQYDVLIKYNGSDREVVIPNGVKAIGITNQLIPLVEDAEKHLKSARNWSFVDVLGGGFFTDLIKHSKLGNASNSMEQVNYLMQRLQNVLGSINVPQDYTMNVGGFLTFADFFFDNAFMDAFMTSKILSSIGQIQDLKAKLYSLKAKLETMI